MVITKETVRTMAIAALHHMATTAVGIIAKETETETEIGTEIETEGASIKEGNKIRFHHLYFLMSDRFHLVTTT